MEKQKILKTRVKIDDGKTESVDTIWYDNKLWLVTFWIDRPELKLSQPGRLVRLDTLVYQKWDGDDFALNGELPKALFLPDAPIQPETNYEVVEKPDLWFEHRSV